MADTMTRMGTQIKLQVTDMHTGAEAVRIVTGGYPELQGDSILERRRDAQQNHDHLRRLLMREPRGHAEMYGVIPTAACDPSADLGVLFIHNGGYSSMCGHATIALGRFVVDQGIVDPMEGETHFMLECPCGLVEVRAEVKGGKAGNVSFESVAGYLHDHNLEIETGRSGRLAVDIAYGGAYYAIISAGQLGLELRKAHLSELKARAMDITNTLRNSHSISHPDEPELGFVYGTIITEDNRVSTHGINHHLCFFAEGQLDRSPTGSGVTARLASGYVKGELEMGQAAKFAGISGAAFEGRLSRVGKFADYKAAHTVVSGRSYYCGQSELILEADDSMRDGFLDPETPGDIWKN